MLILNDPLARRVYWQLKHEESLKSRHDDVEMHTSAAREMAFPNLEGGYVAEAGDDGGDDAEAGDGDVPRVSKRLNTGDFCFNGPVTKGDTREMIAVRTAEAAEKTAKQTASANAREARKREEIANAFAVAKALEIRFNDPNDNHTVDKVTVPELKQLLIFHNIDFNKSDAGANKQCYLGLVKAHYGL